MQPRRRVPATRWLAVALLLLGAAGCAPQSVTEEGRAVYNLYNLFLYIAAVVFVVVSGLVIWSVVRYRRRDDELPKQTHGNNRLELTWTLIPTVIVLVLFGFTLAAQDKVLDQSGQADVNLTVTAFQWSWRFTYEGTGDEAWLHEQSRDVVRRTDIRSSLSRPKGPYFYVPQTRSRAGIPGTTNLRTTFERPAVPRPVHPVLRPPAPGHGVPGPGGRTGEYQKVARRPARRGRETGN